MVPRDRRLTLFIRRQRDRTDSASYFDGAGVPGAAHHVVPGTMTYPLGHCGGRSADAVPVSATEPSSPNALTTMPDTIHLRASDMDSSEPLRGFPPLQLTPAGPMAATRHWSRARPPQFTPVSHFAQYSRSTDSAVPVVGSEVTLCIFPHMMHSLTGTRAGGTRVEEFAMTGKGGSLPLDGITVVACEQAVAAPLATRHLADLGARVIKVERPGSGDFARGYDETVLGMSSHFVWLNRSKESLALDLKQPGSVETVLRLLARADVFVQNFAPGAAERLGLGAAALRLRFPRLITCSISGYGSDGPYRDAKAYDLLIQSEAGLVSVTGSEAQPAKSGIPAADIGAGMYAFSGILAALYERERTGAGAEIEVSLFDALTEWMGFPLYYAGYGGEPPRRTGADHPAIAPYGTFTAGDGREVVLAIQNEREWVLFCERVMERGDLATEPRFESSSS